MECMVNSDNVVRGGLTPKLKDVTTLCDILPYQSRSAPQIWQGNTIMQSEEPDMCRIKEFLTSSFEELRIL